MRRSGPRCFVTFPSVHHVMAAEDKLLASGVPIKLVQIPRELSSDCGTALEFECGEIESVLASVGEAGLSYETVQRLEAGVGEIVAVGPSGDG